jgi:hypothetical protein
VAQAENDILRVTVYRYEGSDGRSMAAVRVMNFDCPEIPLLTGCPDVFLAMDQAVLDVHHLKIYFSLAFSITFFKTL